MADKQDLVILGSGSTAFAAALRAQSHGARVLMIEKSVLGGTCVNWGCIPSKTLIHAAQFYQDGRLGARVGLGLREEGVDFARLTDHKELVVGHLRQTRYLDVLKNVPGLTLLRGTGRFLDPRTLEVGDQQVRGEKFLIATGGYPRIPAIPGLTDGGFLTSRTALLLRELPRSLVIIGGGVIALEMGQMYRRLGTRVTVLEHGYRVLPTVDSDVALAVQEALRCEGMDIVLDVTVCGVTRRNGATIVQCEQGGGPVEFVAERLLVAVGTAPATADIGLDRAGVEIDPKGFVRVDERLRTSASGIWAAGDAIGGMMIATAGAREGIVAVDDMFTPGCGCTMDHLVTPMAIFTDPEVGLVGHTETTAREAGYEVVSNILPVSAIPKAHVTGQTAGVIKLVADAATGRILGAHLACHRGADIINEAALAVQFRLTVANLANSLHVYPTMGEGLRLCAQGFDRDVSMLSCCAE
ncbi:mercury(II) reductase [Geobacter sp. AOG1]|uniref:mercury(II) reductase n=1 Tax=Geobacter sp. AOG1 TaxID=1566346 RepID=UPI001CC7103B|nr:mercury(II) reductase [Geobacter sp. AOG1]GFE57311.1 mercury(II) reductase [Geobacter sp. AOG1]